MILDALVYWLLSYYNIIFYSYKINFIIGPKLSVKPTGIKVIVTDTDGNNNVSTGPDPEKIVDKTNPAEETGNKIT